ncbi:MAG TPA: hypothetical protein VIC30_10250 [Orrella sp.]
MDPFKKLPGYRKAPAGLERKILRLIPRVFVLGTILMLLPSALARLWTMNDAAWVASKFISTVDIYAIGLLTVLWTGLFTVGVGAFTVMVMKGPAYVADAYPLPDADKPRAVGLSRCGGDSDDRNDDNDHSEHATRYAKGTNIKPLESDKTDS